MLIIFEAKLTASLSISIPTDLAPVFLEIAKRVIGKDPAPINKTLDFESMVNPLNSVSIHSSIFLK